MKRAAVAIVLAIVGCGDSTGGPAGPKGQGCTVIAADGCAVIDCGEDPVEVCDGADGAPGEAGAIGSTGPTGPAGPRGADGEDGLDAAITSVTHLAFADDNNVVAPPGRNEECIADGPALVSTGEDVLLFNSFRNIGLVDAFEVRIRVSPDGVTPTELVGSIPVPAELTGPTIPQEFEDVRYITGWEGDLFVHVCARSTEIDRGAVQSVSATVMTVSR